MDDRTLLELAAKVANLDGLGSWDERSKCLTDHEGWYFDPLNDNHDAFQLMVKLQLSVEYHGECIVVTGDGCIDCVVNCNGDSVAAARRAIVRAASRFATTAWLIGINVFPTP